MKSMEERAELLADALLRDPTLADHRTWVQIVAAEFRAIRKEALEEAASVVFSMGAAEKIRALIEEGGPEEVRS